MGGRRRNRVLYGLIFIYTAGCFAVWLWGGKNSASLKWVTWGPISALIIVIIAIFNHHRSALKQERLAWLLKTRELELEAEQRSAELNRKNVHLQTVLEDIHHLGYYDALTDLPNRRLFIKQLTKALNNARQKNYIVAVLFIDMDNFKRLNDTMGHTSGDLVLKTIGARINNSIRDIDTVSRQGGDEFTVLLDEITSLDHAKRLIEAVNLCIKEPFIVNDTEIHIEASIGVAIYPRHGDNIDNLIKYADIAMYNAKEKGKNQTVIYTAEMHQFFARRMSLENELRSAIQNEEFSLYYQPQIDIISGEITGVEALVRWHNHILGAVTPSELIPIAEENGQIIPLGEWVLSTACRQFKVWLDEGYMIPKIAVNISPVQFNDKKFVEGVKSILQETELEPHYLELEITEGVAICNEQAVLNKLLALKDIGIKMALDDFGTGYSCLAYLSQYPVDTLKIDRSFVENILNNLENQIIVETIIILAHNFNLNIIAEGVDTIEQFNFLREKKCDQIQGYLISEPISTEQLIKLVELYIHNPAYHRASS